MAGIGDIEAPCLVEANPLRPVKLTWPTTGLAEQQERLLLTPRESLGPVHAFVLGHKSLPTGVDRDGARQSQFPAVCPRLSPLEQELPIGRKMIHSLIV